ncbi:cellulose biosynthesis protein BcsE [Burkholderia sp. BCCIQ04A]|uniref:Cellulose biosynthesis protein BcsE n=1 Tax=Burkholderia anthinoferrum TaxID=3090833 RepID=A0ABU5WMV0_9BURK|nr:MULTISPECIES: cellulose biosynthesis protein BcsE [Burkholderia]MEB2506547.1 cellulose biosynthesis protein BcsE [Burkholderia anthinoferrum]MEB2529958.1 cellulose biosynthesis protein BcsE [Burkholderia anthinoferrum]MEB2579703.1 cellulose biosynthesis protein BcsE [Burkholderia anthinoferrum]KVN53197.1 cellulose biosynthesis protein BcsE [Burkholderia anthina]MDF3096950.1 cellulose biosynthesis protein BcsE [Burkholderia semiarida]
MTTEFDATRLAPGATGLVDRVRALLRMGPAGGRAGASSRLAIDGLPDAWTQLDAGGLYAIYAAGGTPGCDALVWESARQARTRDVTIVLARDPASVAAQMASLGFAGGAQPAGWPRNLNVLAMPPAAEPADAGAGADAGVAGGASGRAAPGPFARLTGGLRAMKRYGLHARSLYFVEGAQRWFSWDDPVALAEEAHALAGWCRTRRIALVLLLDPEAARAGGDTRADDAPLVRDAQRAPRSAFHGICSGVAQLQRTHGELLWVVDFWRAGDTLAAGEVRPLRFAPGGRLTASVDGGATEPAHRMKLASDEDRVVVSRAVLDGASRVPDGWEIVDDNAAVVAACANAQAATAVLVFRSHAQLEALCADVHTLRRQCGGALKIAVVERGEVLRQQFEMLVLSVGANRVVARDLPVSRMQAAVHALHGQLYARPVAADYRAALAAALGDSVLGYLPVGAFCQRIRAVLDRGAVLALPHTLAKLTLLPGVSHVDALRHCRPRRAGDVVTADAGHLFVFLFACEPVDAEDALARIFDVPVDTLSDRVVCLGQGSIDTELDALKAENRRAPIADYSDLFAAARPPGAARAAATPVAPGAALPDASEVSDAIDAIDTVVALDAIGVPQASAPAADAAAAPDPVIPAVRARGAIRSAMPLRKQEDA